MSENILEVKDLHYKYSDGTYALKGISLKIRKGHTTAILGANGAGKSTLFLNMNGILKPTTGQLLFNGLPVDYSHKGLMELRKAIGLVFQDPDRQLFSASVYQDVSFGPVNMKLPEEAVRKRVDNALGKTGTMELKDKPTHSLSFGQKKRAAIAGILAMEPELMVMDEPTAGLDPMGASEILKLIDETRQQLGLSVVIATHDIDIVPLYCDYVYVLEKGELILEGTAEEVFSQGDILRSIGLRLPRIGHLMEILMKKDGFELESTALTISEARRVLNAWKKANCSR
jgi:cobalt/nickel transport system ATP-binding protein